MKEIREIKRFEHLRAIKFIFRTERISHKKLMKIVGGDKSIHICLCRCFLPLMMIKINKKKILLETIGKLKLFN